MFESLLKLAEDTIKVVATPVEIAAKIIDIPVAITANVLSDVKECVPEVETGK